jgi:sortase A
VIKAIANVLVFTGVILLVLIFLPVIKVELKYNIDQISNVKYDALSPPNTDFSIIIPKIDAVAPIVDNVDPQNQTEYLKALREGVAHAKGTAYPGGAGNVYLFAHSTDAFYNVGKYNAVFYLLGKLSKGDEVFIYYMGEKFRYLVDQVKVVAPNEIKYLAGDPAKNTLTLQTCYPPGTTLDRLIVIANEVELQ